MYDISPSYKQYIHRAGRAARAEKLGVCINLLYPEEKDYVDVLGQNSAVQELDLKAIEKLLFSMYKIQKAEGWLFNINFEQQIQTAVNMSKDLRYMARWAFNSFCRAYQMLKDKSVFNLKKLNLHVISWSYGLQSSWSKDTLQDKKYTDMKDAKSISEKEQKYLDIKQQWMKDALNMQKQSDFYNEEFAN